MRQALERAPTLLDVLDKDEREIAVRYFLTDNATKEDSYDTTLITARRKLANAALGMIAVGEHKALEIDPKEIWGDDEDMKSYLQEWLNIGMLIHTLQEAPTQELRDVVVQSLFGFHAKYQEVEERILSHQFMARWPNV
jgi:hypothetical protein